jgi:hypothetical protein
MGNTHSGKSGNRRKSRFSWKILIHDKIFDLWISGPTYMIILQMEIHVMSVHVSNED